MEATIFTEPTEPTVATIESPVVAIKPAEPTSTFMKSTESIVTKARISVPIAWMPEIKVIPRPSTDEDATCKPLWPPIAIGCTGKWIIRIVTVPAHRGRIVKTVIRAYLDANHNLGVRINTGER